MGLYLAVFDGDEELEGVEVGSYRDFAHFRADVAQNLEGGEPGSRFPVLMLHSDCEGNWSPAQAFELQHELEQIQRGFQELRPRTHSPDSWQAALIRRTGASPKNLAEAFFDIDGEPLIERLLELTVASQTHQREILFQ